SNVAASGFGFGRDCNGFTDYRHFNQNPCNSILSLYLSAFHFFVVTLHQYSINKCYKSMKKISSSFLKSLNWLLTSVLMLLGFSTCDSEPGAAMYGTPHADFTIKGKVVNQENMPIPDIEIKCLVEHHGDNRHWFDTIPAVSTDPAGVFHCQFEEFPTDKLRIIATDIDGPQNGSYEKDSTNLTLSSDDYKGNTGSWFKGSVEKEIKFNLKRKDKE
ncbi:MAG: radical SAM-associated putative lipoprotein, partial [Parabacteroides merdae]|nr:radical SAM-associated putative lipoprotein [Parabacteroides merdae]